MAKGQEVAKVQEQNTSVALPTELENLFLQDEGQGTAFALADMTLPRLGIIQSLSPQRQKKHEKYIPGAEEGMLFNSVTGELFDGEKGVLVIPTFHRKIWNEWIPRDAGGGFIGTYDTELDGQNNLTPGNELIDTHEYYLLLQNPTTLDLKGIVASMTKTQAKVARNWNTRIQDLRITVGARTINPPLGGTFWLLQTVQEENKRRESYFNYKVTYSDLVREKTVYDLAKKFREEAGAGKYKVQQDVDATAAGTDPDGTLSNY